MALLLNEQLKLNGQLNAFLISSGQTYGTKKAVTKKDEKGNCNLGCLNDDMYKMSKYFYAIGASVTIHHNNKVSVYQAKVWFKEYFNKFKNGPKVIYYTGHGDTNGNLCFDDGELSLDDILQCTVNKTWHDIFFIKDCCYAAAWGKPDSSFPDEEVDGQDRHFWISSPSKWMGILCSSSKNQTSAGGANGSEYTNFLLPKLPKDKSLGSYGNKWINFMKTNYEKFERRGGYTKTSLLLGKLV
eukprot:369823_1